MSYMSVFFYVFIYFYYVCASIYHYTGLWTDMYMKCTSKSVVKNLRRANSRVVFVVALISRSVKKCSVVFVVTISRHSVRVSMSVCLSVS